MLKTILSVKVFSIFILIKHLHKEAVYQKPNLVLVLYFSIDIFKFAAARYFMNRTILLIKNVNSTIVNNVFIF